MYIYFQEDDLLYVSPGYRGPRQRDNTTDPLAGEFALAKEKPRHRSVTKTLVLCLGAWTNVQHMTTNLNLLSLKLFKSTCTYFLLYRTISCDFAILEITCILLNT